jgi:potassium/hydrogen antiporter
MESTELILLGVAGLLVISVLASKAAKQTGIPALLLFLLVGMLVGVQGPGQISLDNPHLVQSVGVVALVLILFSGGLDTSWEVVMPVLWSGLTLANLGVLISAAVMGVVSWLVLGYSPLEGMLLGAIISSTDAAAVFTVLRARGVNLKGNLEPLIEFESGSNDPMAVFLTVTLTGLVMGTGGPAYDLAPAFFWQMALGTLAGYAMGHVITWAVNKMRLGQEGLYPVLTLSLVLLTYSLTAVLGGNGYLAIYLAGIVMNGRNFVHKRSLMRFHDGLAWLMQIVMFITLGLQVLPSNLLPVVGTGLLMAAALIFVARPLSVFLSLALTRFSLREKLVVSWVGLRGAVPIVLATFPLLAGVPHAATIFNIVFFIVISSVLLQGMTIPQVASWLGVRSSEPSTFHYPHEFAPHVSASSRLIELTVADSSSARGRAIMDLGLPSGALVVSINRAEEALVPGGGTVLEAGDRVLVLSEEELMETVRAKVL